MEEYTIRDNGGAIISRGYFAESEESALVDFCADNPQFSAYDCYAAPSQWND